MKESLIPIICIAIGFTLARAYFGEIGILGAAIVGGVFGGIGGAINSVISNLTHRNSNNISLETKSDDQNSSHVNDETEVISKKDTEEENESHQNQQQTPSYYGFGGWLYLVTIGQIYSLYTIYAGFNDYYSMLISGEINELIKSGYGDAADRMYLFIILAIIIFAILLLLILTVWYFAIRLSRYYKNFNVILYAYNLISTVIFFGYYAYFIDYLNATFDLNDPIFPKELINPLIGAIIGALIWIPYFLKSKRVANTFVK